MSLKKGMPKSSKNPDDIHGGSGTFFSRKNLPSLQGIQVKATETSSTHPAREMEKEADSFERKGGVDQSKDPQGPVLPFDNSNSSTLKGMVCRCVEQPKERTQTRRVPEYLTDQGGRKQVRCHAQEERSKKTQSGDNSQLERWRDKGARK